MTGTTVLQKAPGIRYPEYKTGVKRTPQDFVITKDPKHEDIGGMSTFHFNDWLMIRYTSSVFPNKLSSTREIIHAAEHESIHAAIARLHPTDWELKEWRKEKEEAVIYYMQGYHDRYVDQNEAYFLPVSGNIKANVATSPMQFLLLNTILLASIHAAIISMGIDIPDKKTKSINMWITWASNNWLA